MPLSTNMHRISIISSPDSYFCWLHDCYTLDYQRAMAVPNDEEKSTLSLRVTEDQKLLIYSMWAHYDWEVELADVSQASSESVCAQCNGNMAVTTGPNEDPDPVDFHIPPQEGEAECPYCLCQPCVTSECFRQFWWETENYAPNDDNSRFRKEHYKRFWVMLLNRGIWRDPRYLARKATALQQDLGRRETAWTGPQKHPRDLIPKCVLTLVRQWLPNATKPYMGHRWS